LEEKRGGDTLGGAVVAAEASATVAVDDGAIDSVDGTATA